MTAFAGSVRRAGPMDHQPYAELSSLCFEYPYEGKTDPQEYYDELVAGRETALHRSLYSYEDKYVAELDGQVVAGVVAIPYTVSFDGGTARMCGIGGVCTAPPYRRSGAVREIMEQMLRDEFGRGTEFSFLYPFSQAYYGRFGYAMSEPRARVKFAQNTLAKRDIPGSFSLFRGGEDDPSGFFEAYDRMAAPLNMMVRRERCDYVKLLKANPFTDNTFAYLYRDGAGTPRGYLLFRKTPDPGGAILDMDELVYDSPDTLWAILGFCASFATDYPFVRFRAPAAHPLERLCADQALGGFERVLEPCGMLRVVHLENALRAARYRGDGEVTLRILDRALGQDRTLTVRYRDGRCEDIAAASNRAPDAAMEIGDFSAALLGRVEVEDFQYIPTIELFHVEQLRGIFYRKPLCIADFF